MRARAQPLGVKISAAEGASPPSHAAEPEGAPAAAPAAAKPATLAPPTGQVREKVQPVATTARPAASAEKAVSESKAGEETIIGNVPKKPMDGLPPDATAAQQYCFNTSDSANDARVAWQAKKIKAMEAELDKRIVELQTKTDEYKLWLQKRDEFSRKAQEKLVGLYAKMKPDAAALQFAAMDEDQAAALLMKLENKVASLILAELPAPRAAKVAAIISGAARIPPNKRAKPSGSAPQGANPAGAAPGNAAGGAGSTDTPAGRAASDAGRAAPRPQAAAGTKS